MLESGIRRPLKNIPVACQRNILKATIQTIQQHHKGNCFFNLIPYMTELFTRMQNDP